MPLAPPVGGHGAEPQLPSDLSWLGAGSALDINKTTNELHEMTRQMEKEAAIEQLSDVVDRQMEVQREAKSDLKQITAPTARAGYLVAGIVGLLLFWFMTTVVFVGNKIATGVLIVVTALFFLMMLKQTLEKKGARYIAETGGVALGVV